MTNHDSKRRPSLAGSALRLWLAAFAGFICIGAAWVLATPLATPPDEPSHVGRAYALMHGHLIGAIPGGTQPLVVTAVDIPAGFDALQSHEACANQAVSVPASCVNRVVGGTRLVPHLIYTGRYPPLYYLFVGLPTLALHTPGAVYWMRLISVVLSGAFLAAALVVMCRRSRNMLAPAAVGVAITPVVVYLSAAVNPSGLEIASTLCLWVAVAALLAADPARPGGLVGLAGVSAVVVVLARADSPLWPAVIAVCLAPLVSLPALRRLFRRRDVRWWSAGVAVAYVGALVWIVVEHALATLPTGRVPHGSALHRLHLVLGEVPRWLREYVGAFGALNTLAPRGVYVVFAVLAGGLIVAALARSDNRQRLSIVLTLAVASVLPVALELFQSRRAGLGAQGRYFLPFVVGAVIVPAMLLRNRAAPGPVSEPGVGAGRSANTGWGGYAVWGAWGLAAVVGACQVVTFAGVLRRFTVGVDGPLSPLASVKNGWVPPLPPLLLDVAFLVGVLWLGGCLVAAVRTRKAAGGAI